MGRFPVGLEVFSKVLAGVLQLVFVQDDVKHFLFLADGKREKHCFEPHEVSMVTLKVTSCSLIMDIYVIKLL